VPVVAGRFTDSVSIEVPDPVKELGLNDALVRLGKPVTLRFTMPENPTDVIVTV